MKILSFAKSATKRMTKIVLNMIWLIVQEKLNIRENKFLGLCSIAILQCMHNTKKNKDMYIEINNITAYQVEVIIILLIVIY